jgi:tripartite-type tricarboxylate transporter receptor subunit TctC
MTISMPARRRVRCILGAIFLPTVAAFGANLISAGASWPQTYPSKVIKLVVPLTPGSPIDVLARLTEPQLSSRVGQTIVVENRPGGGGTIASKAVATAAPDGYTVLFTGAIHTLAPVLFKSLDYDPVKDFTPIATVGLGSWVLVVAPSVPAKSVQELVTYAKAHPGKLNWGYGINTGPHFLGEMFKIATGIQVANISYRGGAQVLPDMLGGRIHMNFATTATLLPLIRDGKLRALAVTSEARSPDLPDVPTMIESGLPRLPRGFWGGLLAPAGTPVGIVNRLNAAINAGVTSPEMTTSLAKLGFEPKTGSPQDFAALIVDEVEAWTAAAKSAGIQPE